MINDDLSYKMKNEFKIVSSEEARKKFNDLVVMYNDVAESIKNCSINQDEYASKADSFFELICCDEHLNNLSSFGVMIMLLLDKYESDSKMRSVRKHKGAYSIPDKVIDGVISNIIHGERVEDACSYAGISTVTLYNRIRDRGYKDIKKFFKDLKRSLKEEN